MIARFSDHAANERTYLAWVRTAVAVMAFGFVVEKFDLFLSVAARSMHGPVPTGMGQTGLNQAVGEAAGLLLILLGGAMMAVATWRFRRLGQDIDAAEARPARGTGADLLMVSLLLTLAGILFAYLAYTVLRRVA